jgi:hypothetical protein
MTSTSSKLLRRSLLQLAGGAATLSLLGARGVAQSQTAPKRLIVVFVPDGTIPSAWRPQGSETDFRLGPILAPLAPHQSDLIVLDGVRRITQGVGDGHEQGMTQILTGRANQSGATRSTGPSVDEFVNQQIGEGRLALRLGVLSRDNASNWTRMTFGESGNVLHPENDPYGARDALFEGFDPDPMQAGPSAEELRRRAVRGAALDYASERVARLVQSASQLDRPDLQAHLQALEGLKSEPVGTPSAQCSLDRVMAWQTGIDPNAKDSFPDVAQMQLELMVAAMACDRARVGVLQFAMSNSEIYHKWAGADGEHHGLSHYEFGYGDPFRTEALVGLYTWHTERIAWLVDELKKNGVFDNTLILVTSEMGEGKNHSPVDVPMLLIGSAGGHFQTGRYKDYRKATNPAGSSGVSHCDVLTSVCNAMGIQTDAFGEANKCGGPLQGLT